MIGEKIVSCLLKGFINWSTILYLKFTTTIQREIVTEIRSLADLNI